MYSYSPTGRPGPAKVTHLQTPLPTYSDVPWLAAGAPVTIAPGATGDVDFTVDATTLSPGVHPAALHLATVAPGRPRVGIPIRLTVTP
ncbi:hypothetical protein [Saccharothrix obliqua]|uniref:hypothetical protein n=1 Tax=Saccharothrix obliqua TaxID=2861747 RepID=UPI001C5E77DC|nr:hypothetical protein [Saccharothrix obliqua]MBW4718647.1 hypothetical protein [Saccharothrix obliqua]